MKKDILLTRGLIEKLLKLGWDKEPEKFSIFYKNRKTALTTLPSDSEAIINYCTEDYTLLPSITLEEGIDWLGIKNEDIQWKYRSINGYFTTNQGNNTVNENIFPKVFFSCVLSNIGYVRYAREDLREKIKNLIEEEWNTN